MKTAITEQEKFLLDTHACEVTKVKSKGIFFRFIGNIPFQYRNVNGFNMLTFDFINRQLDKRIHLQ